MAFKIKRGLVLRTTKPIKVKGQSLATGTRVKAMSTVDKNTLKVKVKDSNYPKLAGEHAVVSYDVVAKVGRGRPSEEASTKPVAKKAAKKGSGKASKPAAKRAAKTAPVATAAPTPVAESEDEIDGE